MAPKQDLYDELPD